jgi:hypothetical protein
VSQRTDQSLHPPPAGSIVQPRMYRMTVA